MNSLHGDCSCRFLGGCETSPDVSPTTKGSHVMANDHSWMVDPMWHLITPAEDLGG